MPLIHRVNCVWIKDVREISINKCIIYHIRKLSTVDIGEHRKVMVKIRWRNKRIRNTLNFFQEFHLKIVARMRISFWTPLHYSEKSFIRDKFRYPKQILTVEIRTLKIYYHGQATSKCATKKEIKISADAVRRRRLPQRWYCLCGCDNYGYLLFRFSINIYRNVCLSCIHWNHFIFFLKLCRF